MHLSRDIYRFRAVTERAALKTFRSLVVLKRPQQELWTVMRDHLVDFSGHIADIEEIRQIERTSRLPTASCTS